MHVMISSLRMKRSQLSFSLISHRLVYIFLLFCSSLRRCKCERKERRSCEFLKILVHTARQKEGRRRNGERRKEGREGVTWSLGRTAEGRKPLGMEEVSVIFVTCPVIPRPFPSLPVPSRYLRLAVNLTPSPGTGCLQGALLCVFRFALPAVCPSLQSFFPVDLCRVARVRLLLLPVNKDSSMYWFTCSIIGTFFIIVILAI